DQLIQLCREPAVDLPFSGIIRGDQGQREPEYGPELLLESAGGSYLLPLEWYVISRAAADSRPLAEGISSVALEYLLRADEVVQGFGHLMAVLAQRHAIDQNGIPGPDPFQGSGPENGVIGPGA